MTISHTYKHIFDNVLITYHTTAFHVVTLQENNYLKFCLKSTKLEAIKNVIMNAVQMVHVCLSLSKTCQSQLHPDHQTLAPYTSE